MVWSALDIACKPKKTQKTDTKQMYDMNYIM